jgi:flagella basal body P-ring formation protein FlgA
MTSARSHPISLSRSRGAVSAIVIALCAMHGAAGSTARADTLAAARNLPAHSVLTPGDLVRAAEPVPGALLDASHAIGRETRVAIYAGRPLYGADLTSPAVVERNQIVPLTYFHAGLAISTDGRALDRGSVGDRIRVMNLSSRSTVIGLVGSDGSISVAPN